MKSVQIEMRSFCWSVFFCIRTEYRKIRTRKISLFAQFKHSLKQSLKQYHLLRDVNQLVLNCKRFSYFWPFTHSIAQNTTHSNIMYVYRGYSPSTSLGKGEGVNEESNKWHRNEDVQSRKWCPSHKFFYALFFCNSSFIPSWFLMKPW